MKVNKNANGIQITGEDWQYVYAEKRPNANTKIIREILINCKAKDVHKFLPKAKEIVEECDTNESKT